KKFLAAQGTDDDTITFDKTSQTAEEALNNPAHWNPVTRQYTFSTPTRTPSGGPEPAIQSESQNSKEAAGQSFRVKFNEEFKLGGYSYKIYPVRLSGGTGGRGFLYLEKPSTGATYVYVNYLIRNDGDTTAEMDSNDLRLLDADGRLYLPDDRARGGVPPEYNPKSERGGVGEG